MPKSKTRRSRKVRSSKSRPVPATLTQAQQPQDKDPGGLTPWAVLRAAVKAVPSLKYALAVLGIVSAIAIIKGFGIDFQVAVFGTIIMIGLMTALVVFAALTKVQSAHVRTAALVLMWSFLALTIMSATLLFTSAFFSYPRPLARLLEFGQSDLIAPQSQNNRNSDPNDETELVNEFIARYREHVNQNRGYILVQVIHLNRLKDLPAWQQAQVDGSLWRLKKLCDSRDARNVDPETVGLIGTTDKVAKILKLKLERSKEDLRHQVAFEKWSKLTLQLGKGPKNDVEVQAWQKAGLELLNLTLTVLATRERELEDAVQKWRTERSILVASK